jgi:hypothetical protein
MALTAGYSRSCSTSSSGGCLQLWLGNMAELTSYTLDGDGTYSAQTMTTGSLMYLFEFEQDTAEFREVVTVDEATGSVSVSQEIEFFLKKMTDTSRDAIQALIDESSCGLHAVVKDGNGTQWVLGYNEISTKFRPLRVLSDNSTTGKAFTDANGSTVILKCVNQEKARTFTGTPTTS